MRNLPANIKQALFNPAFFLSAFCVALIIVLSSAEGILNAFHSTSLMESGYHMKLMNSALKSNALTLALPILSALPFTASFIDDMKSGFIKEYLPRTSVNRYVYCKSVACLVSGGLVMTVGLWASYVILALVVLPMEARFAAEAASNDTAPVFADFLKSVALYACSGAFLSTVGLAFGALTYSKYMAYASPFVLYYVLIILNERYFGALYVLYPLEWLSPSPNWMFGGWGVACLMLELTTIMDMWFASAAKRRIERL